MLTRLLSLLLFLSIGTVSGLAQTRTCGTMDQVKKLERARPNLREQLKHQARTASSGKELRGNQVLASVITIPVVVHVVYNQAEQNISDAQVQSQIDALNRDFRRKNTDISLTPYMFIGVAADAEIEFCLAQRSPDNEPSNGITRTRTDVEGFNIDDRMKSTAGGGQPAWDTEKYLNIWVVPFDEKENLLGYAQFPNSGSPLTDGVVVDSRYFGTTGTATAPYNKGRTTTHEVGHWLNLFHIWGDSSCGDDEVADTPTQEEENVGCPNVFPSPSCGNVSDMYMNYMDYTDDGCMNLFTQGQKAVMRSAISRFRPGLLNSNGCLAVALPEVDAALIDVAAPGQVLCQNSYTPAVVLRNRGTQTLTQVKIEYQLQQGTPQTYTWTGVLPSLQSVTLTLPSSTAPAGRYLLSFKIISRNNLPTDANPANDQISAPFQIQGIDLPLLESFEGTAFPPVGWAVSNPDGGVTWARTTQAAKSGAAAVFMDNFDYDQADAVDELILPPLDLTSRTSPLLAFQVAYALYSPDGFSDTLEVWISKDCGLTFHRIYQKFGPELVTTTPAFTDLEFVPKATEWRLEVIDLSAFASSKTAIIKFRHISDYENNLYLDDVKIDGGPLSAAKDRAKAAISVSPNPTSGVVQITSPEAQLTGVRVFNAVGRLVMEEQFAKTGNQESKQISLQQQPNGVYILQLTTNKGITTRRVVLVR